MKTLLTIASVLVLSAAPALAGQGQVSHSSLAKMGLSGMQVMSDDQGMQIRGLSVAVASGGSIATIHTLGGSATSVNAYYASGSHDASGDAFSVAGTLSVNKYGISATVVGAGGASSAHAN
ncbi:MAG TPA: hypothetical protein VEI07_22590 [Planctomycetaceae bacterium]|nr:hypothetical protein [Planctomycetaceae bacterium]